MGRFGKLPVEIPEGVQISISDGSVVIKGPKGELNLSLPKTVKVKQEDEGLVVDPLRDTKQALSDQGTTRSHLLNIVMGLTEGWKKQLEINGPGYRAELRGKELVLSAGHSHPINFPAPDGITFTVEKNLITVEGIDKGVVGQTAAKIKDIRRPNVYTGAGIKYADEVLRRKAGKQAAAKAE